MPETELQRCKRLLGDALPILEGIWDAGSDGQGGPGWQSKELIDLVTEIKAVLV